MTKLLFFYILLFCSFPAFGETILLRGKIVDQKKNPVGSAYVEVQNDNSQIIGYTLSDTLGFFTMALPPKPEYQVNITHVAFNPLSKKVVPSEKEHLFVMDERVENIDEVVVTSSYTKAMRMNSEGNIVFAPKTLGNLVTYNLPRLLQILPSIQITSSGITQNGRPTALLVNGHKRNLSGKSIEAFLRAIPTDKVKEIVITPISSAGVGCGALTFLPDKYIFIWILSSVPFYIYLYICYQNYLLFYEQVENTMVDEMPSEEEASCSFRQDGEEEGNIPELPSGTFEIIEEKINAWINTGEYVRPGLTIKELSKILHTNRTYLSTYINTVYNRSFRNWITDLRMEYAKQKMTECPEKTIAEIAEISGFLSMSHFTKTFKEKEGCSPAKWKKTNQ